jgi:hypothetical protein
MKHQLFSLTAALCFFLFGCSNISSVQHLVLSQSNGFSKILVVAKSQDTSQQQNVEYRTVREFRENGVLAYPNYEPLTDTVSARLVLHENGSAELFDITTSQIVWTCDSYIAEDFVTASKEITNELIAQGIVVRTPSAIANGKEEIGGFIWVFSALLVTIL